MANNIAVIAECTTHIVLIDANIGTFGDTCEARVRCCQKVEKAKANIAEILMSPGYHMQD